MSFQALNRIALVLISITFIVWVRENPLYYALLSNTSFSLILVITVADIIQLQFPEKWLRLNRDGSVPIALSQALIFVRRSVVIFGIGYIVFLVKEILLVIFDGATNPHAADNSVGVFFHLMTIAVLVAALFVTLDKQKEDSSKS